MLNSINNAIVKTSRENIELPIEDKVKCCFNNYLIPWLDYNNANTEEILIKREIIYDLKSRYGFTSLHLLAETVDGTYSREYWIKKSGKNISCVHVSARQFVEFLAGHPQTIEEDQTISTIYPN